MEAPDYRGKHNLERRRSRREVVGCQVSVCAVQIQEAMRDQEAEQDTTGLVAGRVRPGADVEDQTRSLAWITVRAQVARVQEGLFPAVAFPLRTAP
jgi:hypothetical protein